MSEKLSQISDLRQNYTLNSLLKENVSDNPFTQFAVWFEEAVNGDIYEPNAMILSTVSENQPKSRTVLLKALENDGFVFYSNYDSHKGEQMADNNKVSLLFYWDRLQRQVRIEGTVSRISEEISTAYFQSRPRSSQLGAWASKQSEVIENEQVLVEQLEFFTKKFEGIEVLPKPENWGGYVVNPNKIEFWQGRPSRLHDRLVFDLVDSDWKISRLSP
ncbi:MAG: pyridoxamine 5'-phosphate oxidase [Spirosomaceae bacterium]|nr:pyridoxamine 5'-phosphate oxidase [Spirosomataceae bacterium]